MRTFGSISRIKVSLVSTLLIAVLSSAAWGQGVEVQAGDPAPFAGVLITLEDLARTMMEKDAQINVLQVRLDYAKEKAAIELAHSEEIADLLREEVKAVMQKNLAWEGRYESLRRHVGQWRFGLGLLFLKSPN